MTHHTGPTIERLREMSELVTLTVDVADVQETRIDGHVGAISALLIVKGDVQVGVDLAGGRLEQIDNDAHRAVLVLPEPSASRPRLDHERSRLYALRQVGLWQITPGDRMYGKVTDQAWLEAQQTVARVGAERKILEHSRRRTEQIVNIYAAAIGWTIEVRWPGRP